MSIGNSASPLTPVPELPRALRAASRIPSGAEGVKPQSGGGRIEYLDTVRGLAALCVVVYHYITAYGTSPNLTS